MGVGVGGVVHPKPFCRQKGCLVRLTEIVRLPERSKLVNNFSTILCKSSDIKAFRPRTDSDLESEHTKTQILCDIVGSENEHQILFTLVCFVHRLYSDRCFGVGGCHIIVT